MAPLRRAGAFVMALAVRTFVGGIRGEWAEVDSFQTERHKAANHPHGRLGQEHGGSLALWICAIGVAIIATERERYTAPLP
jgi:hypothetical protein